MNKDIDKDKDKDKEIHSPLDDLLFELNQEMIGMCTLCEEAITDAVKAVITLDTKLASEIKDKSTAIDYMERNIEHRCMKLLLHWQPVATDLRIISAALKMITDMERIGDQAEDIAEIVVFLKKHQISNISLLEEMAKESVSMVTACIQAFVRKDLDLAKEVIKQDDIVDNYFYKIKCSIVKLIEDKHADASLALDLLMIAKYLERIGDHACNIAEWVIYSITGKHKANNDDLVC